MIIHGFNKLTLLDYPRRTACTLFTGGCNLRCPFCHNATLVMAPATQPVIAEEEIFTYLKKRKGILDGVCITGGEPTLDTDLIPFMQKVKDMGYLVKLDTNGTRPDIVQRVLEERLADYIAMDIKNSPKRYADTVGISNFNIENVRRSVLLIMNNPIEYEFRTTVVRELHTATEIAEICEWLHGAKAYYLQAFKDSGDLIGTDLHGCTNEELEGFLRQITPYFDKVGLRGV